MSPGPSPLYAAAAVELPLPSFVPAELAAELATWLADHDAPTLDGHLRIVVDEHRIWGRRLGQREEPWSYALTSHPSTRLLAGLAGAGVLFCAATTELADGTERYRCNVLVDQHGRHRGQHADGRFGDEASWPNGNPSDLPPRRPAPAAGLPTRDQLRVVLAAILNLCDHDRDVAYAAGCRTCPAIDRAAAAVHAMIGAPS